MLNILIAHKPVRVAFRHHNIEKLKERYTECMIFVGDELKGYGLSKCSVQDSFVKEFGRKQSLTRALARTTLTKSGRKKIWNAYFEKKGTVNGKQEN